MIANGKTGDLYQWGTTDTAIGGKKCEKQACSSPLCPAGDRSGRCRGPGSPYSKAGTAEDGLPHPARPRGCARRHLSVASIAGILAPTQCGSCCPGRYPVDFPAAHARVASVPAGKRSVRHSCGDSIDHNARAAERKSEEHRLRRIRGVGSARPHERRIHGIGTPQTQDSMRDGSRESRMPPSNSVLRLRC